VAGSGEEPGALLGHVLDGLRRKATHRRGPRLPGRDLWSLRAGAVHPLEREEEAAVVHHGDADVPLPLLCLSPSRIDDLPGIHEGEGALGSHARPLSISGGDPTGLSLGRRAAPPPRVTSASQQRGPDLSPRPY